jgi:hypothetical protein
MDLLSVGGLVAFLAALICVMALAAVAGFGIGTILE